jgi:hypothetical protein
LDGHFLTGAGWNPWNAFSFFHQSPPYHADTLEQLHPEQAAAVRPNPTASGIWQKKSDYAVCLSEPVGYGIESEQAIVFVAMLQRRETPKIDRMV